MSANRVSTWTRFRVPGTDALDTSLFKPLISHSADYCDAFYGQVAESPEEYLLVVIWNSQDLYDAFRLSAQHEELFSNLRADSADEPETQIIDFGKIAFWWRFGPDMEIFSAYFPSPVSEQTKEAVNNHKGLVTSMGHGIDGRHVHLSPYRSVPVSGWSLGERKWDGKDVLTSVWCHYWSSQEAEQKFKTTERRPPKIGETERPLAVDNFQDDIKELGAIGWDQYHISFIKLPKVIS